MMIHDFPASPNCQKVRAVLYELGLPFESSLVHLAKGESRTADFLAKNPNGKVPLLEDGDFVLWESNAILGYLAEKSGSSALLAKTPRERADVERWMSWQLAHLGPAVSKVAVERIVKKLRGRTDIDEKQVEAGTTEFQAHAEVLEKALGDKEYITGRLSLADFALAPSFNIGQLAGLTVDSYPRIAAWLSRMNARESMKRARADAEQATRS